MELNEKARRLLVRCEGANLKLPEKAFVYSEVTMEAFLFFDTADASANPPIFGYYERDGKFKRVADSFWDQLETDFAQAEVLEKKHPEHSLLPAIRAEERAREIRARMANRTNLEFARELVH